jgi:hypothetical protein
MKTNFKKIGTSFSLIILFAFSAVSQEWKPVEGKMMTPFGKNVTVDNVWQKYPRPQLVRGDWMNLNGLWEYAIRPVEENKVTRFDGKILVPFCVESTLSGVGKFVKKDNNLWYRRNFIVPDNWKNKQIILNFGAVDYSTTVWINGKKVGNHKGGHTPFSFNITPYLKKNGEQQIVLSVWDPVDDGYQPRGKQVNHPEGIWYTSVTGIWQTVWLEPVEKTYIEQFYPISNIDKKTVTFKPAIKNLKGNEILSIDVKDGENIVAQIEGNAKEDLTIYLENAQLWSPDNPFLYDLEITLSQSGKVVDKIDSYFAMRKVSLGENSNGQPAIMLNNKDLFQYGTLDQGWWPDGLYTPPSEEAMKYDLIKLKEMGFNMLRKHIKVEPARLYYDCDKLGLLVWQDMPSCFKKGEEKTNALMPWYEKDWDKPKEEAILFEQELQSMIDNLRFFQSIVMWVNFNEGWGQYDTERLAKWVKEYDSDRLVNAVSGWTDRNCGDIFDMHQYASPCFEPHEKFPGRVVVLGEFGGLGLPIKGHLWFTDRENWGYENFPELSTFTNRYIQLMQQLKTARYSGIAAAVYTQTTDVEGEVNGMLTYDREVCKIDPQILRILHEDLYTTLPKVEVISNDNQLSPNQIWVRDQAPLFIPNEKWELKEGLVEMKKGDELWFKKDFIIENKADGYFLSVWACADVDFIINGKLAFSKYIDSWRHYESINLSQYLDFFREGKNSIVLRVNCTRGAKPFDFGIFSYKF